MNDQSIIHYSILQISAQMICTQSSKYGLENKKFNHVELLLFFQSILILFTSFIFNTYNSIKKKLDISKSKQKQFQLIIISLSDVMMSILPLYALKNLNIASQIVMRRTYPIQVVLYELIFENNYLNQKTYLSLLIQIIGSIMLIETDFNSPLFGQLIVCFQNLYNVIQIKILKSVSKEFNQSNTEQNSISYTFYFVILLIQYLYYINYTIENYFNDLFDQYLQFYIVVNILGGILFKNSMLYISMKCAPLTSAIVFAFKDLVVLLSRELTDPHNYIEINQQGLILCIIGISLYTIEIYDNKKTSKKY